MENSDHRSYFYKFLIIKVLQLKSEGQLLAHDQHRIAAFPCKKNN